METKDELKPLRRLAIKLLKENWAEIDKKDTEISHNLNDFINLVKNDDALTMWVLTEVMTWGCGRDSDKMKPYLAITDSDENEFIIKIGRKYFKLVNESICVHYFVLTKPKFKKVLYFE